MAEKTNIDGWAFKTKRLNIAQEKANPTIVFGSGWQTDFRFTNVTNIFEKTKFINKGGFYAF